VSTRQTKILKNIGTHSQIAARNQNVQVFERDSKSASERKKSLPNELEYIVAALLFSGAREGHPLKSCTREKHRPDLWYIHFSKTG
jgi:hypothetical protein